MERLLGVDGTKIKANANRDMLTLEKIDKRTHKLEDQLENYLTKLSSNDNIDDLKDELDNQDGDNDEHLINKVVSLQQQIETLEKEKMFLKDRIEKVVHLQTMMQC